MNIEDHYVPLKDAVSRIFIKRFYSSENAIPLLAIHGSIENGRIFYNEKGTKGIAAYLAANGYDVFVPDLRGKGRSEPKINKDSDFGNRSVILEDFEQIFKYIDQVNSNKNIYCIAHSWGGVLLSSYIARSANINNVKKAIYFGTRRNISIWTLSRILKLEMSWNWYGKYLIRKHGYFPYKDLGYNGDNESKASFTETNYWLKNKWVDHIDGFNYIKAFNDTIMPDTLWMIGEGDKLLGNQKDMLFTKSEINNKNDKSILLGTNIGLSRNYGHNDMLTHKSAVNEIFPLVVNWLRKQPMYVTNL